MGGKEGGYGSGGRGECRRVQEKMEGGSVGSRVQKKVKKERRKEVMGVEEQESVGESIEEKMNRVEEEKKSVWE